MMSTTGNGRKSAIALFPFCDWGGHSRSGRRSRSGTQETTSHYVLDVSVSLFSPPKCVAVVVASMRLTTTTFKIISVVVFGVVVLVGVVVIVVVVIVVVAVIIVIAMYVLSLLSSLLSSLLLSSFHGCCGWHGCPCYCLWLWLFAFADSWCRSCHCRRCCCGHRCRCGRH